VDDWVVYPGCPANGVPFLFFDGELAGLCSTVLEPATQAGRAILGVGGSENDVERLLLKECATPSLSAFHDIRGG